MRVLWFTITSSLFEENKHHYHGAGWISSLESLIAKREDVDLGIAFYHSDRGDKIIQKNTTYYPIKHKRKRYNPIKALIDYRKGTLDHSGFESKYVEIINDFNPDIIHVFGTESSFAVIGELTSIPVLLQTQGLINPIVNTCFPINQSKWSFFANPLFFVKNILGMTYPFTLRKYRKMAVMEAKVLKGAKFIIGRTEWDKMIVKLYNPKVQYFHVDEVLRPIFYNNEEIEISQRKKQLHIISTISPVLYKGIDVVLKTAKLLKEITEIDFIWEIVGLQSNSKILKHIEQSEKIKHKDVNVLPQGILNPKELALKLKSAHVYIHPSYIDNSPNSICEAQMLGLPVIACNVGGVSSLIESELNGLLVPSNGVFEIANAINLLNNNRNYAKELADRGQITAIKRHNKDKIQMDILNIYTSIS